MGRPRTPRPIQDFIREQWKVGRLPKQIQEDVAANARLSALGVPAIRTIQKYVGEYEAAVQGRATDAAQRDWTLGDGDGDVLLPLLQYLKKFPQPIARPRASFNSWSKTARHAFGQVNLDIARRYVAILRAKPSIPIPEAWSLAIDYWGNEAVGGGTYELDEYLAFEPWVDNGEAYVAAIQEGRLLTEEPRETGSTRALIQFLREALVRGS